MRLGQLDPGVGDEILGSRAGKGKLGFQFLVSEGGCPKDATSGLVWVLGSRKRGGVSAAGVLVLTSLAP